MAGDSSFEKCLWTSLRPSLPGNLLFVCGFIDFSNSSKEILTSQRWNYLSDIFFLPGILLRSSAVAVLEVVFL